MTVERELLMPFVTVSSHGGPHEDNAYAAGWEMGVLDTLLEYLFEYNNIDTHYQMIHTDNVRQADLIVMRHGWTANFVDLGDGWTNLTCNRNMP
jgi:hypothetical protein